MFKKTIKVVVFTFLLIVLLILMTYISRKTVFNPLKGAAAMENDLKKNRETLALIKAYFTELEYNSVHINYYDGTMFVGLEAGSIPIENDEIKKNIQLLFENGYQVIGKKASVIYFPCARSKTTAFRRSAFSLTYTVTDC